MLKRSFKFAFPQVPLLWCRLILESQILIPVIENLSVIIRSEELQSSKQETKPDVFPKSTASPLRPINDLPVALCRPRTRTWEKMDPQFPHPAYRMIHLPPMALTCLFHDRKRIHLHCSLKIPVLFSPQCGTVWMRLRRHHLSPQSGTCAKTLQPWNVRTPLPRTNNAKHSLHVIHGFPASR